MKWLMSIVILSIVMLSGCSKEANNNTFAGIEKSDISDLANESNVAEFKGSSENWAAVYFNYTGKDNSEQKRIYLKYIGDGSSPTGDINYNYDLGNANVGSGSVTFKVAPEKGIYYLGPIAKNEAKKDKSNSMNLQIIWNGDGNSESIVLRPVSK